MNQYLKKALRVLSGYELAFVLFLLLFVLTYLGTVTQVEQGLYQAQKKYFESVFLVHYLYGIIPLPLPGAYPLMVLLFVNLLLGGVVRARKGWRQLGILTAHVGILVLLLGAFISYRVTESGHMTLYEGEQASAFQSYSDWEIAIAETSTDGPGTEYVIAPKFFERLAPADSRTFTFTSFPFDLVLSGYAGNAELQGNVLRIEPNEREPELNRAGARVKVRDLKTGAVQEGVIWAGAKPFSFSAEGKSYRIAIRRQTWPLPFTIELKKFTRELHPRTNMPREFRSDVVRIDNGTEEAHRITMNEPMRYGGYTLYQASWGPQNAGPGERLFSTLAVVRNPAERYPIVACIIISVGLLIHFAQSLARYLRTETRKTA